jgi:large subunit ribosomal protein L32
MGLPGHRRTSSHKRRRAAHFALSPAKLGVCPKCKKPILPHRACVFCGTYQGREVVKIELPKKKEKK